MLYTRKGDGGTTKLFDCPAGTRLSKSAPVFAALGAVDELNSCFGYVAALAKGEQLALPMNEEKKSYEDIIVRMQEILFCIQAELGGSDIHAKKEHVDFAEAIVAEVEKLLPPITSFIILGGSPAAAYLDVCRTIARRTERAVVTVHETEERKVSAESLQFLNRLSSVFYALARFANFQQGIPEKSPKYG